MHTLLVYYTVRLLWDVSEKRLFEHVRVAVLTGLRFSLAKLFRTEPEPSRKAPFRVRLLLSPLYNEALCVLVVFERTSDGGTHRAPYVLALSSKPHHIYSLMRTAVRQFCCQSPAKIVRWWLFQTRQESLLLYHCTVCVFDCMENEQRRFSPNYWNQPCLHVVRGSWHGFRYRCGIIIYLTPYLSI